MSVPALRFNDDDGKEFPEWEEKTLGATLSIFSGYAFSSADSQDDGVKWLKIADVGIQQMTPNNISYLPIELKDKHSNFLVYKNDYVIALTRPILNGKLKIAKVDEFYDESLLNQRVGKLITAHDIDFIYFLLQHKNTISHIADTISGTDPPNLSLNAIKDICLIIPTNKIEQTKIANFLTAVDQKISLLTQKATLLSQYKKGVMQQIFKQELRFKDDDGQDFPEWEEKTLGEVTTYTKGFAFKSDDYQEDGIRIIRVSDLTASAIKQNNKSIFIDSSKIDKYESYRIKRNDILITTVGSKPDLIESAVGRGILITNNDEGLLNQNLLKLNHSTGLENGFLFRQINSERYITHIKNIQRGNANQSNITLKDLFEFVVFICGYKEQTKIANFLTAVDDKITNNQNQLDAIKQYKQGLLQLMFV